MYKNSYLHFSEINQTRLPELYIIFRYLILCFGKFNKLFVKSKIILVMIENA